MAQDRFIYWEDDAPAIEQVGQLLADYFGAFAIEVKLERHRYTVLLVGAQSNPYRRVGPEFEGVNLGAVWDEGFERWIEVYVDEVDKNIDVITRMADPATAALADGFVALAARRWGGRIERG